MERFNKREGKGISNGEIGGSCYRQTEGTLNREAGKGVSIDDLKRESQ